jgi:integrase
VRVARALHADDAALLVATAPTIRAKAILTLLWRTGARIGDWISESDRHGVLGLALRDVDARRRVVCIRLKRARSEHRVPVTDDVWGLWNQYLVSERGDGDGSWGVDWTPSWTTPTATLRRLCRHAARYR